MIVVPDYIWMPLVTWGIAGLWFHRHELFGIDEEDLHENKKSSR